MILIGIIIALIALIAASINDLKTREVPDYISYGLIIIGFMIAVSYSIIYQEYTYIAQATMGFLIAVMIAYLMFYLGQWGGGDSKLLMGLGTIVGFNIFEIFGKDNFWLFTLIAGIIVFGAIYGLTWTIVLAIKKRKLFLKNFSIFIKKKNIQIARTALIILSILFATIIILFVPKEYQAILLIFTASFYILFYLWLCVKIIEETCMIKAVPVVKLTEGDWIYKDVYIGKKYLAGPKDLGISKEQISLLIKYKNRGKIKTVMVKEGIPFIPAFLLAFIALTIIYYIY